MGRHKLGIATRALALFLVLVTPAYAVDADVPNVFTARTVVRSSDVNENFESLEDTINRDQMFYAVDYAAANPTTDSGGIVEAYTACVAAGGGTVKVPNGTTAIDGADLTNDLITFNDDQICHIEGYGSPGILDDVTPLGGSILRFTNSAGITAFNVLESGVRIANLALYFDGADATTTGIYCGEVNNLLVDDVNMEADGASGVGAGIGIDMYRCLKGTVRDTETHLFAIGLRADSYSNASGAYMSRFRGGGLGIHMAGTDGAIAEEFTLFDVTVEGNERGLLADNNSTFVVNIIGSHFEQNAGTLASRYNIRITSAGFRMNMVGGSLGGVTPADRDYYRTAGSTTFGPDTIYGANIHNGIECSGTCAGVLVDGARKIESATTGVFSHTNLYHATDCPAAIIAFYEAVYGMTCGEPDGDIWQCQDLDHASGTDDTSCDHADEIVKIVSGGYLTTSDPIDGSTACDTGDRKLNTSNDKLFFCTDGSTDDWYGVQLTDSP